MLCFYELQTLKTSSLDAIQKADVGIVLAVLALTTQADGTKGRFFVQYPGIAHPENAFYIASYELEP